LKKVKGILPQIQMNEKNREISGSHGGNHDGSFLGYRIRDDLMMEAVRTSETSVYFYTTRLYIPEDCHLRKTLWSYAMTHLFFFSEQMNGIALRYFTIKRVTLSDVE
jgi:hypothetical protein